MTNPPPIQAGNTARKLTSAAADFEAASIA